MPAPQFHVVACQNSEVLGTRTGGKYLGFNIPINRRMSTRHAVKVAPQCWGARIARGPCALKPPRKKESESESESARRSKRSPPIKTRTSGKATAKSRHKLREHQTMNERVKYVVVFHLFLVRVEAVAKCFVGVGAASNREELFAQPLCCTTFVSEAAPTTTCIMHSLIRHLHMQMCELKQRVREFDSNSHWAQFGQFGEKGGDVGATCAAFCRPQGSASTSRHVTYPRYGQLWRSRCR